METELKNTEMYDDLERYLFGEVTKNWAQNRELNPAEFRAVIRWKAWRANGRVKFIKNAAKIAEFTKGIYGAADYKELIPFLLEGKWNKQGMRLPLFSAFLGVFKPDDYPVIDIRVMAQLRVENRIRRKTIPDPDDKGFVWYFTVFRDALNKAKREKGLGSLRELDKHYWNRDRFKADIEAVKGIK